MLRSNASIHSFPFAGGRNIGTARTCHPCAPSSRFWRREDRSCPDPLILSALKPKKRINPDEASRDIDEYDIPNNLPDDLRARLASFEDLCVKDWSLQAAA
jgi:hypothetical protein